MVVIFLAAGSILWIIRIIIVAVHEVDKSKNEIIALNLAREGIEAVYQIRNTNRMRWSGKRDQCWLKREPLFDRGNLWCQDDEWIGKGVYQLLSIERDSRFSFALDHALGKHEILIGDTMFSRHIIGLGVFLKNTNRSDHEINCLNGLIETEGVLCWSADAKEFRFCSRVDYQGSSSGSVELCGLVTNFVQ